MLTAEMRRCLDELDVAGARQLWAHAAPHLSQSMTDKEALVTLHHARTQARSIRFHLRAYSHRWLVERGYPSGMPNRLRSRAERIPSLVVEGVGIASLRRTPVTPIVQSAMSDAVLDVYSSTTRPDPVRVKSRMMEIRRYTLDKLLGPRSWRS